MILVSVVWFYWLGCLRIIGIVLKLCCCGVVVRWCVRLVRCVVLLGSSVLMLGVVVCVGCVVVSRVVLVVRLSVLSVLWCVCWLDIEFF